jgi:hypothetical protein
MRTLVLLGWLMVPVAFGAYHFGPGQERLRLDDAARALAEADRLVAAEQWQTALTKYDEAQALLPEGRVDDVRRIRIKRAKVQMLAHQLPEASAALEALVGQLQDDKTASPALRDEAREAQANAQYYMTWLMRLEGLSALEWEPEIESARQTYRLLAEQAESARDQTAAKRHSEDLESAIRLARLDVGDLQGLSIPSQCQGCKSGQCKKPGRKAGKNPNASEKKDARGASAGPPPDKSGS